MKRDERHQLAVGRSLSWAEEAAEIGDFASALAWLDMVASVDDALPEPWLDRKRRWEHELAKADQAPS